jgi:CspA family cold shock protein
MSTVMKGVVKWFNNAKGFGFIEHTSGKDVFVHYSVIQDDGYRSLKDGEEVEYEITEGPKGMHASRVSRVNNPKKKAPGLSDQIETIVSTNGSASSIIPTNSGSPSGSEEKAGLLS